MLWDGAMARPLQIGDVIAANESQAQAIANAAGVTWTAANALTTLLFRSGAAAVSDTTPDASSWINAMLNNAYLAAGSLTPNSVQQGVTYRLRVVSTNSGLLTIVAGTGVTLAGTTTIAATSFRDYLVTVLNGTAQQLYAANTTNASAVVTGLTQAQTQNLTPGMLVSGTGITGGTTILSVQYGVGITLSANATATGSLVALTFSPRIEFRGIATGGV